jgi:hypothetical protein
LRSMVKFDTVGSAVYNHAEKVIKKLLALLG